MYGLFAGPDHLNQINQAFVAAPPAAHLEQLATARDSVRDFCDGSAGPPMNCRTLHSRQASACAAR
jgi:hypothetical protein